MLPATHHSANTAINIAALGEEAREREGKALQVVSSTPDGHANVPLRWRQKLGSMLDDWITCLRHCKPLWWKLRLHLPGLQHR